MNIEDRVARPVLGNGKHRLCRLHHLPHLGMSGGNDADGTRAQFGVGKSGSRTLEFRVGGVQGTCRRARGSLGLVEITPRRKALRHQGVLPGQCRLGLPQLSFCGLYRRFGRLNIGLLLARIDLRQKLAFIDMGADIGKPLCHLAADAKGKVCLYMRHDFTGQGDGLLVIGERRFDDPNSCFRPCGFRLLLLARGQQDRRGEHDCPTTVPHAACELRHTLHPAPALIGAFSNARQQTRCASPPSRGCQQSRILGRCLEVLGLQTALRPMVAALLDTRGEEAQGEAAKRPRAWWPWRSDYRSSSR